MYIKKTRVIGNASLILYCITIVFFCFCCQLDYECGRKIVLTVDARCCVKNCTNALLTLLICFMFSEQLGKICSRNSDHEADERRRRCCGRSERQFWRSWSAQKQEEGIAWSSLLVKLSLEYVSEEKKKALNSFLFPVTRPEIPFPRKSWMEWPCSNGNKRRESSMFGGFTMMEV